MRSKAILRARRLPFEGLPARESHAQLKRFVEAETLRAASLCPTREATPLGWWIRKMLHLICMPLFLLLASPLLILIAPFYLFQLRRLEKTDPEPDIVVDDDHFETLAKAEDHDVTNPYSALGSLKPGLLRQRDPQRCSFGDRLRNATHYQARTSGARPHDPLRALGADRRYRAFGFFQQL